MTSPAAAAGAPYDMDDNKPAGGRDEEENAVPQPKYPLHKDISLGLSGGRKLGDLDYRSMAKVPSFPEHSCPKLSMLINCEYLLPVPVCSGTTGSNFQECSPCRYGQQ